MLINKGFLQKMTRFACYKAKVQEEFIKTMPEASADDVVNMANQLLKDGEGTSEFNLNGRCYTISVTRKK